MKKHRGQIYLKKMILTLGVFMILIFSGTLVVESGKVVNSNCNCTSKTNSNQKYALGLIVERDENGHIFSNPVTLSGNPPEKWDWRNAEHDGITGDWTTSIKDQAGCGSCWAFGVIAAFESVYNIQENDPNIDLDLSEQMLVSCGMNYYPMYIDGCCGGSIVHSLKYLQKFGTVSEDCFSYKAIDAKGRDYQDCDRGDSPSNDPVKCSDKCENWKDEAIKVKNYQSLNGPESIKNAIVEYGPVIAAFAVYQDFFNYEEGIYEQNSDDLAGWHVIAIVGYDDDQQCWICKNSWNEWWGEANPYDPESQGGWFRIKYGECEIDAPGNSAYINGYTKSKTVVRLFDLDFQLILYKILKIPLSRFFIY
jgi:C1A family cysteine protease